MDVAVNVVTIEMALHRCKWCAVIGLFLTPLSIVASLILIMINLSTPLSLLIFAIPFAVYIMVMWGHMIYACTNSRCHASFTCCTDCLKHCDCDNLRENYNDPPEECCFYSLHWICCPCFWCVMLCCFVESQKPDIEKGFLLTGNIHVDDMEANGASECCCTMCCETSERDTTDSNLSKDRTTNCAPPAMDVCLPMCCETMDRGTPENNGTHRMRTNRVSPNPEFCHSMCKEARVRDRTIIRRLVKETWRDHKVTEGRKTIKGIYKNNNDELKTKYLNYLQTADRMDFGSTNPVWTMKWNEQIADVDETFDSAREVLLLISNF